MSEERGSTGESGKYRLVEQRRTIERFGDWLTWAVRGVTLGTFWLMYQVFLSVNQMHENIAILQTQIQSHSQQLEQIWREIGRKP
jgi:hypothetical protein